MIGKNRFQTARLSGSSSRNGTLKAAPTQRADIMMEYLIRGFPVTAHFAHSNRLCLG